MDQEATQKSVAARGLEGVCGHARIVDFLRTSLGGGKLAHAYLFAGPTGVGKRTTGVALAQAFHCSERPGAGCGECMPCSRIARGLHPDHVEVRPEQRSIKVSQVRDLEARAELGPHEGPALVIVIAPADRMTLAAANALLKTLEEPRPNVHFVLTAAAPHSLPATIRSRCQLLRFGPVETTEVRRFLVDRMGVEEERADLAARLAEGSIGRAVQLSEEEGLGSHRDRVVEVLKKTGVRPKPTALFDLAEQLAGLKDELGPFLDFLQLSLRDLVWNGIGEGSARERVLDTELLDELGEEVAGYPPEVYLSWRRVVQRAQKRLLANANKRLTLEQMLIELAER